MNLPSDPLKPTAMIAAPTDVLVNGLEMGLRVSGSNRMMPDFVRHAPVCHMHTSEGARSRVWGEGQ